MSKKNCWEHMNCAHTNPDAFVDGKNTCPAFTESVAEGINCGENAGRVCWAISGTLARDGIQGFHTGKVQSCEDCEFYQSVKKEEGDRFVTGMDLVKLLLEK